MGDAVTAVRGGVDPVIASDFPGLSLWSLSCLVPARSARRDLRERLAQLDDRARGIAVGALRTDSVAGAYRGFARQIGLDPDVERNPLDAAALERLTAGRLVARGSVRSALLIAMLETHVPLWAFDAAAVHGWLHIAADEDSGRLAIADEARTLAPLLGEPAAELAARDERSPVLVYALLVEGVPAATVHEAFWHVRSCLEEDARS
jgi:hypothetical protein